MNHHHRSEQSSKCTKLYKSLVWPTQTGVYYTNIWQYNVYKPVHKFRFDTAGIYKSATKFKHICLTLSKSALTRQEHKKSKQQWDNLHGVVSKEFKHLEGWVKDIAQKHIDELTKILRTDLSETEVRWACEEQIEIISSLKEAWQKKLDYIKTVLSTMETEVL